MLCLSACMHIHACISPPLGKLIVNCMKAYKALVQPHNSMAMHPLLLCCLAYWVFRKNSLGRVRNSNIDCTQKAFLQSYGIDTGCCNATSRKGNYNNYVIHCLSYWQL